MGVHDDVMPRLWGLEGLVLQELANSGCLLNVDVSRNLPMPASLVLPAT